MQIVQHGMVWDDAPARVLVHAEASDKISMNPFDDVGNVLAVG